MQGEDVCNQFIERCFYSNWMTRIFSNYFKNCNYQLYYTFCILLYFLKKSVKRKWLWILSLKIEKEI